MENIDLGKTQITPEIRVSSAAIFYDEWFGKRYQLETFIFSNNKELQSNVQVIHCSTGINIPENKINEVKKVHSYIANNLIKKFNSQP